MATTPRQIINYANAEMKLPQWEASQFTTTTNLAYSQLIALNYLLRDIDYRDPNWGARQAEYTLSTVADQVAYDLPTLQSGLYPSKVLIVRHSDNYPIQEITQSDYENHVLPATAYQDDVATGKPKFWYPFGNQMYLVQDTPNSVQSILVIYTASLASALTSSDVDSTTAIAFPEKDMNVFISGMMWRTAMILRSDENLIERYKNDYELQILRSSINDVKAPSSVEMDPYWAAMFNSDPWSTTTDV